MSGAVRPDARRYALSPRAAWLDAIDGGRDETVAWAVQVATGATYELRNSAWLLWTLLADGPADCGELERRVVDSGVETQLRGDEIAAFLDRLASVGLVEVS